MRGLFPDTTRRALLGLSVAFAALSVSGCGSSDGGGATGRAGGGRSWPPLRYRLTVEVETPDGVRSGSSVIEVRVQQASATTIPNPGALSSQVSGEAVAVDLPGGRTLFALLRSDDDVDWAAGAPFTVIERQTTAEREASADPFGTDMARALALKGVHPLPRWVPVSGGRPGDRVGGYPMLVTFGDIADPRTIAKVDPDDLAATFGGGVKLRRITVERTDDPVTTGIEKKLEWLNNLSRYRTDSSNPFTNTLPSEIGSFQSK